MRPKGIPPSIVEEAAGDPSRAGVRGGVCAAVARFNGERLFRRRYTGITRSRRMISALSLRLR
jgi:hypothetical protein